eukprot:5484233-Pyramimonas_sp.AAC.1
MEAARRGAVSVLSSTHNSGTRIVRSTREEPTSLRTLSCNAVASGGGRRRLHATKRSASITG